MDLEILKKLFIEQIRDIYDAEKQLTKALPKMAKAAQSEDLAEGLRKHLAETQNHVSRLEEVFRIAGTTAKGKTCKAMKGLIEEGSEAIEENDAGIVRDLAIIAGGQRVEHYEISAYGTARTMAKHLGLDTAVELLQQTENEEKTADNALTDVAVMLYGNDGEADVEEYETEGEGEEAATPMAASQAAGTSAKPAVRRAG